jgi:hypothetical protein
VFTIDGHTRQSTVFSKRSSDAVTSDRNFVATASAAGVTR